MEINVAPEFKFFKEINLKHDWDVNNKTKSHSDMNLYDQVPSLKGAGIDPDCEPSYNNHNNIVNIIILCSTYSISEPCVYFAVVNII